VGIGEEYVGYQVLRSAKTEFWQKVSELWVGKWFQRGGARAMGQ